MDFMKKYAIWVLLLILSVYTFARLDYQGHLVFGQNTYQYQFSRYSSAINEALKKQGLCDSDVNCSAPLEFYGDSSLQIEVEIYNVEGHEKILAKYLEAASNDGKSAAGGVPIKISAYQKPRSDYMAVRKPDLVMEIK